MSDDKGTKSAADQPAVRFWTVGERERLTHTERAEAVFDYATEHNLSSNAEVELFGWAPVKPDCAGLASMLAESLLETFAEEYSDPWWNTDKATDEDMAIMKEAVQKILAGRHVWMCEVVHRERVRIGDVLDEKESK